MYKIRRVRMACRPKYCPPPPTCPVPVDHLLRVGYQRSLPGPDGLDGADGTYTNGPSPDGLPGTDGADGGDGIITIYPYVVTPGAAGVGLQGTPPIPTGVGPAGTNGTNGRSSLYAPNAVEVYYKTFGVTTPGSNINTVFTTLVPNLFGMRLGPYMFKVSMIGAFTATVVATGTITGAQTVTGNHVTIIADPHDPSFTMTISHNGGGTQQAQIGIFPLF